MRSKQAAERQVLGNAGRGIGQAGAMYHNGGGAGYRPTRRGREAGHTDRMPIVLNSSLAMCNESGANGIRVILHAKNWLISRTLSSFSTLGARQFF